jgi:hypothetical protein
MSRALNALHKQPLVLDMEEFFCPTCSVAVGYVWTREWWKAGQYVRPYMNVRQLAQLIIRPWCPILSMTPSWPLVCQSSSIERVLEALAPASLRPKSQLQNVLTTHARQCDFRKCKHEVLRLANAEASPSCLLSPTLMRRATRTFRSQFLIHCLTHLLTQPLINLRAELTRTFSLQYKYLYSCRSLHWILSSITSPLQHEAPMSACTPFFQALPQRSHAASSSVNISLANSRLPLPVFAASVHIKISTFSVINLYPTPYPTILYYYGAFISPTPAVSVSIYYSHLNSSILFCPETYSFQ